MQKKLAQLGAPIGTAVETTFVGSLKLNQGEALDPSQRSTRKVCRAWSEAQLFVPRLHSCHRNILQSCLSHQWRNLKFIPFLVQTFRHFQAKYFSTRTQLCMETIIFIHDAFIVHLASRIKFPTVTILMPLCSIVTPPLQCFCAQMRNKIQPKCLVLPACEISVRSKVHKSRSELIRVGSLFRTGSEQLPE